MSKLMVESYEQRPDRRQMRSKGIEVSLGALEKERHDAEVSKLLKKVCA